jgi:hypothetical protein
MADNGFRPPRRDGGTRNGASPPRYTTSDPLAELARLIGQSDAHRGSARDTGRQAESYDDNAPAGADWGAAAEDDYPEDSRGGNGYAPQPGGSYRSEPARSASRLPENTYEDPAYEEESVGARHYARAPAEEPRGAYRNASPQESHYSDEPPLPRHSRAEPLPYIPPAQGGHLADAEEAGDPDYDQGEEEAPPARRSGTIVIVAVLGLAVLGTAGALGYRAMFGGSMIPSLPPIIKPGDSPIKIVPQHDAQAGANNPADTDGKDTADQLVNHEEQPLNVQPANPVPRVVTTIPVISNAPDAPLPDSQPAAAASGPPLAAPAGPPATGEADAAAPPYGPPPEQSSGPAAGPPQAKTVHTVSIVPQSNPGVDQAAPPPTSAPPVRVHQPAARNRLPAEHTASAGPLSIVPGQDDAAAPTAPPPRPRTGAHGPMALNGATASNGATGAIPESAPERSGGGSFAVQVTSQRSEAEAQAAYRSLQAKYPQQLGDRHAFVRSVNLGAKGVYYRALIGPFASGADAVSLCSSLKAAGGSCLIQRN